MGLCAIAARTPARPQNSIPASDEMLKLGLDLEEDVAVEAVEFGDEVTSVVDPDVGDDGVAVDKKRIGMK